MKNKHASFIPWLRMQLLSGIVFISAVAVATVLASRMAPQESGAAVVPGWLVSAAAAATATPTCPAATGTDFRGRTDLTNHNFHADPPGSLKGANFTGVNLSGAIFAGQDLTGANFQNANLGPSKGPVDFTNAKLDHTCFIGANLDQTDFTFAEITCADFSGTSLMAATFGPAQNIRAGSNCRTQFVGATLDVHLITSDPSGKSNWGKSDFTNASFQNLSPATFSLAGKNITGAILADTAFIGIDMTGANLTDVDFSRANLTHAKLDNAALNGARLYNAKASHASFQCAQFYGTGGGKQKRPDGTPCPTPPLTTDPTTAADFTLATLDHTDFTAAILDHAMLAGANLSPATLVNASLVQANLQSTQTSTGVIDVAKVRLADFTNADLSNAQLASVDFSGGVLTGALFNNHTPLNGTRFDNATMPGASFQTAVLQSVSFSAAILQSAKFRGATMQVPAGGEGFAVNFRCSQLGGADFTDAVITGGDFGGAVMPAKADCCSQPTGAWCGTIDMTQQTYGAVTFPVLNAPVTCPNGEVAPCTDAQWKLSANWQTDACSSDGSMQTRWSKPNCDGKPTDIVVFKDQKLKVCILKTLPGQTEVMRDTAEKIQQVSCPGLGIADLTGLETFKALARLDLSGNQLTQFTLKLPSLQSLDVSDNKLTALDLSGLPKLVMLSAANNQLASIPLNANTYLVVLDASHNQLTFFDLAAQNNLAYADLSYNKLTKVLNDYSKDLSGLPNLAYLDLAHNAIATIGSVQSLAWNRKTQQGGALQSLFLACNPAFDCSTLEVYDGKIYPAAATSLCSRYDPTNSRWTAIPHPDCPPG